jgi:hypothetical protein
MLVRKKIRNAAADNANKLSPSGTAFVKWRRAILFYNSHF